VEDTTGPVITLNGDELVTHEVGVSYKDGGATATDVVDGDLSGVVDVVSTVNVSKPGSYTVSYGVSDVAGNKAKGLVRTVKVQDTTGPVIALMGEVLVTHEAGSSYTDAGAIAVDVVDGNLSEEVDVVSTVDVSKPGSYTVSYGVSDSAGNNARVVIRKVTVEDTRGPVITLKGEALVTHEVGGSYKDDGASATDMVDGDLTSKIVVTGAVDTSAVGTYTLKYDVSDAAGNAAESLGRTVVVEKTTVEKTTVVQTLDLEVGWNLISFYVEGEDMTPATVLASIKGNLAQIKDLKSSYNPTLPAFINTLKALNVKDGYWVKMDADVSFELEGVVPTGGSIPVRSGWNLVGYPRENGAAPKEELTSLGDTVLQFKNLKSSYNPALPAFINTLKVITPGLGYWLNVSDDGMWNVGDVSGEGENGRGISKMTSLDESQWGSAVVYPNVSATVLAEVTLEGKEVSSGSVVGAFVGDELRGQQEVVLANGSSYVTLNVNLQEEEKVTFRLWEGESCKKYGVANSMKLEVGETYGSVENLVKLDWGGASFGVRILSYTRSPFGFKFESELSRSYEILESSDLFTWTVVEIISGNGKTIEYNKIGASENKKFYRLRALKGN
jgi:hypothetical protein